jgi:hypothetical protein
MKQRWKTGALHHAGVILSGAYAASGSGGEYRVFFFLDTLLRRMLAFLPFAVDRDEF